MSSRSSKYAETTLNEPTHVSEILNIMNEENVFLHQDKEKNIIAPGQGKKRSNFGYAIHIKFPESDSLHVHSFIWIFNASNIENDTAYIEFTKKTTNAQLLNHLNDPEFFELIKEYQVHAHSRSYRKYNNNECSFLYDRCFTEKIIIANPVDSKLRNDEKQKVLTWINTSLKQVKI